MESDTSQDSESTHDSESDAFGSSPVPPGPPPPPPIIISSGEESSESASDREDASLSPPLPQATVSRRASEDSDVEYSEFYGFSGRGDSDEVSNPKQTSTAQSVRQSPASHISSNSYSSQTRSSLIEHSVSETSRDRSLADSISDEKNPELSPYRPSVASRSPLASISTTSSSSRKRKRSVPVIVSSSPASSTSPQGSRNQTEFPAHGVGRWPAPPPPLPAQRSFSPFLLSDISDRESQHSGRIEPCGSEEDYDDGWATGIYRSKSPSVAVGTDDGGSEDEGENEFRSFNSTDEEPVTIEKRINSPLEAAGTTDTTERAAGTPESERSGATVTPRDITPSDESSVRSTKAPDDLGSQGAPSETGPGVGMEIQHSISPIPDDSTPDFPRGLTPATSAHGDDEEARPKPHSRSFTPEVNTISPIRLKIKTPPIERKRIRIKGRKRGKGIKNQGYNKAYVELLNKEIQDIKSHKVHDKEERSGSFILGSWWYPREKNAFFNYLATAGQDDIEAIANGVGGKTVLECRAYLLALKEGQMFTENWVRARGRDTVTMKDIPAAVEISADCENELEKLAEAVEARTLRDIQAMEKHKWGPTFWCMNIPTAWQVQALYDQGDIEGIHDIAPEAELLNVSNMLELSECIFMNGPPDRSWRELGSEQPSMLYSTLSDLHQLVVSLTKRLVQVVLFSAQSRIRSLDDGIFHPQPLVWPVDVRTALNIENMPLNSKDYWTYLPRRAGIHVMRKEARVPVAERSRYILPYKKVEELMAKVAKKQLKRFGPTPENTSLETLGDEEDVIDDAEELPLRILSDQGSDEDEDSGDVVRNGEDADIDSSDDEDVDDNLVYYRSRARRRRFEKAQMDAKKEEVRVEDMDAKASRSEEKKLWHMMGLLDGPLSDEDVDEPFKDTNLPKQSQHVPKPVPTEDWRQGISYIAPWEKKIQSNVAVQVEEKAAFSTDDEAGAKEPRVKRRKVMKEVDHFAVNALDKVVKQRRAMSGSLRSPRKPRVRRKSKVFKGFVPTADVIAADGGTSGVEADVGEQEEKDVVMRESSSGSEYEMDR